MLSLSGVSASVLPHAPESFVQSNARPHSPESIVETVGLIAVTWAFMGEAGKKTCVRSLKGLVADLARDAAVLDKAALLTSTLDALKGNTALLNVVALSVVSARTYASESLVQSVRLIRAIYDFGAASVKTTCIRCLEQLVDDLAQDASVLDKAALLASARYALDGNAALLNVVASAVPCGRPGRPQPLGGSTPGAGNTLAADEPSLNPKP